MQRAHEPNSVVHNKFFFRRFLAPVCVPDAPPVAPYSSNVDVARAVASAVIPSVSLPSAVPSRVVLTNY